MPPVVIAAAVTAGSAIIGSAISSHGQQKAADAQTQAANQANQTQLQIFNQQRADAEPWRQMGLQALGRLGQLYGFNGSAAHQTAVGSPNSYTQSAGGGLFGNLSGSFFANLTPQQRAQLQTLAPGLGQTQPAQPAQPAQPQNTQQWLAMDPGYQFRLTEGMNALNTGFAARGMLHSGAAAKSALQYGQNYASNEFGNAYNRLSALAGIGQSVNQSNNALGQNYANNVSQNLIGAGQARASSYSNQGQTWGNAVAGIGGMTGSVINNQWGSPPFGSYPSTFAGR